MKKCSKCNEVKSKDKFYKRSDGNGYRSYCKSCYQTTLSIVCPICKKEHTRVGTKRKSNVCSNCYPVYRQAYCLLSASKQRAKELNIEHSIDLNWILDGVSKPCPKTGETYILGEGNNYSDRNPLTPSIDKIDPTKGYTKSNCQVVCWWYNIAKQRYTEELVLTLCKKIVTMSEMSSAQNVEKRGETNQEII